MNMKILHDPASDALLAQHSNFVPIDIGEVLVRCMNERRGRKKFSHCEKLEDVDWAFSQMDENKLLMAEGVGFERGQRIFAKSTTPQLPPHHQRRTAS